MLSAKKKKRLSLILSGAFLVLIGFIFHNYLAVVLDIYPNKGISFGYFSEIIILLAILVLIFVWIFSSFQTNFYLMMVAVGGTINFIDRIVFGYVRDYWSFFWVYNNLADWIVAVGVTCFIFDLWKKK